MGKHYICAGWKMNLSVKESIDYTKKLVKFIETLDKPLNTEIFLLPDFLSLYPISKILKESNSPIKLGAQDCFWEDKGSFTGEVSPLRLKEIGVSYCLIGHPERIDNLGETPEMINKKTKACLRNGITPVLLVIERDEKKDYSVMKDKLFTYIDGIQKEDINKMILIYEPAWAIGSSEAAPVNHTREVLDFFRDTLDKEFGSSTGQKQVFMYGGGVTLESARDIVSLKNINGVGMGTASLNYDFFSKAIKTVIEVGKEKNK